MNVKNKKIAGTSKYFLKIKKLLWVYDIIFITLEEGLKLKLVWGPQKNILRDGRPHLPY
jgi:hypothetical protein